MKHTLDNDRTLKYDYVNKVWYSGCVEESMNGEQYQQYLDQKEYEKCYRPYRTLHNY